ncbi:ribonuclease P protein component 1 [Natronomonas pharaonis DSM 2160]|uniref:Ribonuclease P protein component 1 n=1 Tax=Natronomonas pharaonis (strain ATCC 35678 / DSM 2160 / CIP 103997 / JCM 8858 / NBRC 14720 / NCIMB 2260 / Gabara) TaxID=348780 RepID=A0A1U7EZ14_NATPD|nr:ribonuclease P protein component 1 [Natronomonas pharaonis]CAI50526.1 ribonuclease P protein component 1 [Natronomonas pharaonis DSM 2160]
MNPETLVRHELVGLDVEVTDAPNPDLVGIAGRVHDETMRTLLVATGDGVKQVPKAETTFRFELDEAADNGSVAVVVEGERLVARPALRTETKGGSLWQ